ncbi:MAG: hypothetical protein IBX63_05405 [Coriobacteriia bacterium]|nr:hypothetical protein [Coriobacteriia bacterium]
MRAQTVPRIARLAGKERRRGRTRTPEEREMIVRGTVALMRRRERKGRLVRIGSRKYEVRTGEPASH